MGWKTTFGLMILFMVLGTFAFFDPLHWKEGQELSKAKEDRILWLKDKKLESISLKFSEIEFFLSCKMPEGCDLDGSANWRITKPLDEEGDSSAIGTLASSLLNLSPSEKLDFKDQPDLAEFGLDKPKVVIQLQVKGDSLPRTVSLGANATFGNNTYATSSDKKGYVFLVPTFFASQVKSDPFHWRNKRVFGESDSLAIDSLEWKGSTNFAAKKTGPNWNLVRPISSRANQMMLDGLVSGLMHLDATAVLAEEDGKKLSKPRWKFQIEGAKAKITAEVFDRPKKEGASHAPEFVFKSNLSKNFYLVEATFFDRFAKSLIDYRYRNIFDPDLRYTQKKITLSYPLEKKQVIFTNDGGVWKYTEGDKLSEPFSEKRVREFYDTLFSKEASDFLSANEGKKKFAGKSPDVKVEVTDGLQENLMLSAFVDSKTEAKLQVATNQEYLVVGVDFLKILPARFSDLGESANRLMNVLPKPER